MTVKITDIITPDVWASYGHQKSTQLFELMSAGVVANVPGISIPNGGATLNLPHFNDLDGDFETLSDAASLTPGKITTGKQVAVVIERGRAWGANDLAGVFAGADPARAMMDKIADYVARQMQLELVNTLTGNFAAASMSGLVHDISGGSGAAAVWSADAFIDAGQKLGDAKGKISMVAMHSATEAHLAKQNLIAYETVADKSTRVATYMGKQVVVDDGLPVSSGVYTTYLLGSGAVGYAEAAPDRRTLELDRDILAGEDYFTIRRRFILHPVGMKWQGTPAADFPTRAELATGTNWVRVYDVKNIPMIAFKHKLTA